MSEMVTQYEKVPSVADAIPIKSLLSSNSGPPEDPGVVGAVEPVCLVSIAQ